MITKAYIQEVLTPYSVKVRIPLYHKVEGATGSVKQDSLPIAYISTLPNVKIDPQVGDVVIVSFEEENLGKPIVIGYLYSQKEIKSTAIIECENLISTGDTTLGKNTLIGDIKYENIECLKNQKDNIPTELNLIRSDISKIKNDTISKVEEQINKINKEIETLKQGGVTVDLPSAMEAMISYE